MAPSECMRVGICVNDLSFMKIKYQYTVTVHRCTSMKYSPLLNVENILSKIIEKLQKI